MARLVNMKHAVPEDIGFDMGDGRIYRVSGKIPVVRWLTLAAFEQDWTELSLDMATAVTAGDDEAYAEASRELLDSMRELAALILVMLQEYQPELTECPFDSDEMILFVRSLSADMNAKVGPDPTVPPPTGTKTANRATRRKSTPSSGSRASRSNSAGRRTTGTP